MPIPGSGLYMWHSGWMVQWLTVNAPILSHSPSPCPCRAANKISSFLQWDPSTPPPSWWSLLNFWSGSQLFSPFLGTLHSKVPFRYYQDLTNPYLNLPWPLQSHSESFFFFPTINHLSRVTDFWAWHWYYNHIILTTNFIWFNAVKCAGQVLSFPFHGSKNWGSEKLSDFPQTTHWDMMKLSSPNPGPLAHVMCPLVHEALTLGALNLCPHYLPSYSRNLFFLVLSHCPPKNFNKQKHQLMPLISPLSLAPWQKGRF